MNWYKYAGIKPGKSGYYLIYWKDNEEIDFSVDFTKVENSHQNNVDKLYFNGEHFFKTKREDMCVEYWMDLSEISNPRIK